MSANLDEFNTKLRRMEDELRSMEGALTNPFRLADHPSIEALNETVYFVRQVRAAADRIVRSSKGTNYDGTVHPSSHTKWSPSFPNKSAAGQRQ